MTAQDLFNSPVSNDTRRAIRTCTDLDLLVDALAMEQARGRGLAPGSNGAPRKSMIDLLQLRIDVLRTLQASDDEGQQVATPATPAAQADERIPEAGARSAAYMAGRDAFAAGQPVSVLENLEAVRGYTDAEALVRDEPGFVRAQPVLVDGAVLAREAIAAQPVATNLDLAMQAVLDSPTPTAIPHPHTPARSLAVSMVRAILLHDVNVLQALLGTVRARADMGLADLAGALVAEHVAQTQATPATGEPKAPRAPRTPRAPRVIDPDAPTTGRVDPVTDTNVARVRAALAAGTTDDKGVVTLSAEQMQAAGFPASWIAHGTLWSRKGRICVAAVVVGYDARYHATQDGPVAVFTPVATPA